MDILSVTLLQSSRRPVNGRSAIDHIREKGSFGARIGGQDVVVTLGQGLNSLTDEFVGTAVDGDIVVVNTERYLTTYSIYQISTADEYRKVVQISASASMGMGAWSGDATASYFSSLERNSYYDYLVVDVHVSGPAVKMEGKIKDHKYLKLSPIDFYKRFGTRYIRSVMLGGRFTAIATFQTNTESERTVMSETLRVASGNYGSGKESASEAISRVSRAYQSKVAILRAGLKGPIPDLKLDAIIDYSKKFSDAINDDTAYPVSVDNGHYTDLDQKFPNFKRQEMIAEDWANKAGDLYADRGDLLYYKAHRGPLDVLPPTFYPDMSENELRTAIDGVSKFVKEVQNEYIAFTDSPIDNLEKVKFPAVVTRVPRRTQGVLVNVENQTYQLVGVAGDGEKKWLSMFGQWNQWPPDHGHDGAADWLRPENSCSVLVEPARGPKPYNFVYTGPIEINGPARISVMAMDTWYPGNRSRGLSAALY